MFGYMSWDPKKRKIIKSRDVVFHEDQLSGDIEKTDKFKEIIDGVVDLTLIPSLLKTKGGKGVQDNLNTDDARGLPSQEVVEQGEQSPRSETT